MDWHCFSLCILWFGVCEVNCEFEEPIVAIGQTDIHGTVSLSPTGEKQVFTFRAIYYAEPPVGNRRFAPPSMRVLPPGRYDAVDYGPLCPQNLEDLAKVFDGYAMPSTEPSEDCLHLDVYTPTLDTNARLPVMVWIHGGAFANGGNALYDGTALAQSQKVVVVVVNYRVGPLGFLSFQDHDAPGNNGLLDQQLALKWIQNNIVNFGGDRYTVTLFGSSSGGMSVSLHLLVNSNRNLFHRAIIQSGPANSILVIAEDPTKWAQYFADDLSCSGKDTSTILTCLRSKSISDITRFRIPSVPDKPLMPFGPVVDGKFLKRDPMALLQEGVFAVKSDILIGYNDNEGGYSLIATRGPSGLDLDNFQLGHFRMILQNRFQTLAGGETSGLLNHIEALYSEERTITDATALQTLGDIFGDCFVVAPSLAIADYASEMGHKTFVYEFQHRPDFYKGPEWVGADHGVEEPFVFGFPFLAGDTKGNFKFTSEEVELAGIMMTYWGNFAKFGHPNGETSDLPHWHKYSHAKKSYMQLKLPPSVANNQKPKKVTFWNSLFSSTNPFKNNIHLRHSDEL